MPWFVAPLPIVTAPLAALLAVHRPGRREALLAIILAGVSVWVLAGSRDPFALFEAAWTLLLTGGIVVVFGLRKGAAERPLQSLLGVLAVAAGVGALLTLVTSFSFAELHWLAQRRFAPVFAMMIDAAGNVAAGSGPDAAAALSSFTDMMHLIADGFALLLPGLLLLQSLAAVALAWSLYRGVAREPVGANLPLLKDVRFSDQLIWGVVVALLALVLPWLGSLRALGGNLAAFFGGLYLLRGFGVLAALFSGLGGIGTWLAGLFIAVFLAPVAAIGLVATLALGVSDTWVDWRRRARAAKHG